MRLSFSFFNRFNYFFIHNSLQAVSRLVAAGNFDALEELVDDETLAKIRDLIAPMSVDEREKYIVNRKNIIYAFPYEIQFIQKRGSDGLNRIFVEIMVVCQALCSKVDDYKGTMRAVNFRFVKEFTKGVEDDWTINYILYGKPYGQLIRFDHTDSLKKK